MRMLHPGVRLLFKCLENFYTLSISDFLDTFAFPNYFFLRGLDIHTVFGEKYEI